MPAVHRLVVPPEKAGERLDVFLAGAIPDLSRSRVRQLIDGGLVRLAGEPSRPSLRVKAHDAVTVSIPPPRPLDLAPEDRPLDVLFEDGHLMVVGKPAGMVVHPSPGHREGTLVHVLLSRAGGLSGIGGVERPGIVHRLDRDTSGLLVAAKTDAAHGKLSAQLASHAMSRRYHGIVWGKPPQAEGTVRTLVGRHPVHRKKMAVRAAGGRHAVTHYRRIETFGRFALVEFRLETGRTHQVRLHCAHLGCPIVGDDVYGRPRAVPLGKGASARTVAVTRFLLHAFHLGFAHPATGEWIEFTASDPPEFAAFRDAVLAAEGR